LTLYALFALATLACGLAPTYLSLMMARVAAGVFGGVLSALSQTIVGDVIPFERRGRAMSIVMTSFSVATVAGVPAGLFLATHLGWHSAFFGIALLCALFLGFAAWSMPLLDTHVNATNDSSAMQRIRVVLADTNHLRAFAFSSLLMFAGFTVIPYITINLQTNVGMRPDQIPYVYLCGGIGTLLTARWIGRLTDLRGKLQTFRIFAIAVVFPLLAMTLMPRVPVPVALLVSTLFFMCMSGRMIPGMAIITSAANPALRGTFMTLNAAVQSAAMGLAALIGGSLISRDAQGLLQNYWMAAVVGGSASFLAIYVASGLKMHSIAKPDGSSPVPHAAVGKA